MSPAEKQELALATTRRRPAPHGFAQVLKDPMIYLMAAAYFCIIGGIYLVNFWLPEMLKTSGVSDAMPLGFYSAIPFITATVGMFLVGRSSDHSKERRWHSAIPALVSAASLAAAAMTSNSLGLLLLFISIATAGMWMAYTVFWSIPSRYLKGISAAGGKLSGKPSADGRRHGRRRVSPRRD
ncbi:MFS transporter [Paraburkholderia sp. BL21I4N1]|uniref:MFS transporter n=1 Tax=Paraburkholderia sp. BL21I4N1 TaxID=1938801 RepID=UPI000CFD7473|nr:MFS transporter [Paraburkholderia sp. BL21I4N1]